VNETPPEKNDHSTAPADEPKLNTPSPDPIAPPATAERRSGNGLALLALLVGAVGIAVGGWSAWQWQQVRDGSNTQQTEIAQAIDEARRVAGDQGQRSERLERRVDALPTADQMAEQQRLLMTLQGNQQSLAQGLSQVMGESREAWRLAEAEHLVRLAMLRLSALQDINSATALLQAADDIIRVQDDPLAFAARGELIKALEALRSLPKPDRNGLYLQLAALRAQVDDLQAMAPEFVVDERSRAVAMDGTTRPWWDWQRWRDTLGQYVRLDLHADQDIRPQLAGQTLSQVRLTLSLAMEQAQWGALNARQDVYEGAVKQAREVLEQYFDARNSSVQSLQQRLGQLSGQIVEVETPDLRPALTRLEAYVRQRGRDDAGVDKPNGADTPGERSEQPAEQPAENGA
jgi:uroporphyrin-III C-methyltransferase